MPAGSDFWETAERSVKVGMSEVVEEIIFAEEVELDMSARVAGVVCKKLKLGMSARVIVAYVTEKVNLDMSSKIDHLFRQQDATLKTGMSASAPRTPILPAKKWEQEANEFMGR